MLQLKKRNVPAAAHSFSILAKKDERELEFLLNFVDAKQQQHLSQVQSFFDGHICRIRGKINGKKNQAVEMFIVLS